MKEQTQRVLTRFLSVNTFLTCKDLSKEFNISERTFRNELTLINHYLVENSYPIITSTIGKGLKLELSEEEREKLTSTIGDSNESNYYRPNERFLALLLDISNTTKKTLLYEMEEILQVSKSTMDEDMRKLRHFLKKYGIFVVSLTKQGIILKGDERSIRSMLYDVINSMTDIDYLMGYREIDGVNTFADQFVWEYLDSRILRMIGKQYDNIMKKSGAEINQSCLEKISLNYTSNMNL